MSSSTSFVPRRSARLAAKRENVSSTPIPKAPNSWISEPEPSQELLDARKTFLARLGTPRTLKDNIFGLFGVPTTINCYLNDAEAAMGANEKAIIATDLYRYIIRNPLVMAVTPRFLETVKAKAIELAGQSHKISDPTVRAAFLATLRDFEYVVAPPCSNCLARVPQQ
jgi:hypothetical protein